MTELGKLGRKKIVVFRKYLTLMFKISLYLQLQQFCNKNLKKTLSKNFTDLESNFSNCGHCFQFCQQAAPRWGKRCCCRVKRRNIFQHFDNYNEASSEYFGRNFSPQNYVPLEDQVLGVAKFGALKASLHEIKLIIPLSHY